MSHHQQHWMDTHGHLLHKLVQDKPFLMTLPGSVYIPALANKSCVIK